MNKENNTEMLGRVPLVTLYEAPRIEAVLTPEELEREVLYAGAISQPG